MFQEGNGTEGREVLEPVTHSFQRVLSMTPASWPLMKLDHGQAIGVGGGSASSLRCL